MQLLRPEKAPRLITPMHQRLKLLECTGIDATVVLSFTPELSLLSCREFAETVLSRALRTVEVHEGNNFRFGHKAEGGIARLIELGNELGFGVCSYAALERSGMTVSSSNVRDLIAEGDVGRARRLLGHTYSIESTPARGRGIGGRLTVPTINLAAYDGLLPALGVYVTWLQVAGEVFESVTNVGNRPTFGEDSFAVETHILNFHPMELSEQTPLELSFLKRLRPELKWPSPEALKDQIMLDVVAAQRYFRLARAVGAISRTT
jgi:riboflavin kinase/FMN adenylyltransferase